MTPDHLERGQRARVLVLSTVAFTLLFAVWLMLGMLSINLMFLNVLPIPVLDGGQLVLLLVEAVTRKRPSEAAVGLAQMAGLVLLLGLMLFISYNDVVRLLH